MMPELTVAQRNPEWFAARRGRVTASLAAACLGWDPYCSRQKAFRTIMGTEPEREPNRHMTWGQQFEAAARLDFEAETGEIVTECGFFTHPMLDWLGGSPDGLIGTDAICEIKCPTEPPPSVPLHHRIQCLINLAVTGRQTCWYWSWGASGRRYLAQVHRAGIPGLIARLHVFYESYVVPGVEPPRKKRRARA